MIERQGQRFLFLRSYQVDGGGCRLEVSVRVGMDPSVPRLAFNLSLTVNRRTGCHSIRVRVRVRV